ncbi:MAG: TadE/TadG family type IV pilus assembly protein [Planctomycetaceae bacterium]
MTSAALASDLWRSATRGLALPARRVASRVGRLPGDERGTISVLTVVTTLGLMFVLGMVTNVVRHIDDKVKMQNAADAAAYSGGVVLARGMNAIAFSNHLLCDTFALTAFMREARDRNAEAMVPDILTAWRNVAGMFSNAQFPKFGALSPAIEQQVELERKLVKTYSDMSFATSELVLPVLESVLRDRLIPQFQREVVLTMPDLAGQVTFEVARRHGLHRLQQAQEQQVRGPQRGLLWRTDLVVPGYSSVMNEHDPMLRTVPAVDPAPAGQDAMLVSNPSYYFNEARQQRERLARLYLLGPPGWNFDRLKFFQFESRLSQFFGLWQTFTCGQLMRLLNEEYPDSNLPYILRMSYERSSEGLPGEVLRQSGDSQFVKPYLDRNFMFVGVVYRKKLQETFAGLFKYPLAADPQAFAQIHLFVPLARQRYSPGGMADSTNQNIGGGGFGVDTPVPMPQPGEFTPPGWSREPWPAEWTLFNQNWRVQIVPATSDAIASILRAPLLTHLERKAEQFAGLTPPSLGAATGSDVRQINTH